MTLNSIEKVDRKLFSISVSLPALPKIETKPQNILAAAQNFAEKAKNDLNNSMNKAANDLLKKVEGAAKNIGSNIENKIDKAASDVNALKNKGEELAKKAVSNVVNVVEGTKKALEKGVTDVVGVITCILDDCPKNDKNSLIITVNNKKKNQKPVVTKPKEEVKVETQLVKSKTLEPINNTPEQARTKTEPIKTNPEPIKAIPESPKLKVPSNPNELVFDRLELQKSIDQRYSIRRLIDSMINEDNSLRLVVTDTSDMESYAMKLYLKGDQKLKSIYQNSDNYATGQQDCSNNKILVNRLYGLPPTNTQEITNKMNPVFKHIQFQQCKSKNTPGTTLGHFSNLFTLPQGRRLDKKCLKYVNLTKHNSCIPFIKFIAKGLLNAIHIMNMGQVFYRHGNIYPHNIYLLSTPKDQIVYLDNMLANGKKYDNISEKPFKDDFNMLADTLLNLITGTNENIFVDPTTKTPIQITGAFDIYFAVKSYFEKNNLDINLFSYDLNLVGELLNEGKILSKAELEYKLRDTVFNFIYRLKCVGITPSNQFLDISQAMQHRFIVGLEIDTEQWDSLPSDI